MKKLNVFLMLILGLTIFSCGNTPAENNEVTTEETAHNHDHDHDGDAAVTQQDGKATPVTQSEPAAEQIAKKPEGLQEIKADESTMLGMANINGALKEFMKITSPTLGQYRGVGKKLDQELSTIFEKCSMKGPSHEKLHEILRPIAKYVKTLNEGNEKECSDMGMAITKQMYRFDQVFNK